MAGSYLLDDSQLYDPEFYNRSNYGQSSYQQPGAESVLTSGAAAAPFMSTPAGAGIMVGSQFLSQYLAQKAADERARREREAQIAQQHGQSEQKGFDTLMQAYRGALR